MKEGAKMGVGQSLVHITDDPRISIDPEEYVRINRSFQYYANKFPSVSYVDAEGNIKWRPLNSVNATKRIAQRMASITFNEQCKISFENKSVDEFLNNVLEENDFKNKFEENLEKGIVSGGIAARPYVDNGHIKIAWIRANQFYPLRSNTNDISEAAIASVTTRTENDMTIYYTLLEFHQWKDDNSYQIINELYRSDAKDSVGTRYPLSEIYPDLQDIVTLSGKQMVKPLFTYFKMPGANNINIESPLGIGIVDNARNILDNLNRTHDSFMWEIRNGRRTVAVPQSMMRFDNSVHKPEFDTDTDVYVKLMGESDMNITDLTNDIRVQQFTDSINFWLKELEGSVGMAPGTFSFDPKNGIQTATAVVSENSLTYQTRSSILTKVSAFIEDLCVSILELAMTGELFDGQKPKFSDPSLDLKNIGINIHYDDGVFVDKDKQMDEDLKNVTAGALSIKTFLSRNYGLTGDQLDEEMAQIQDERNQKDSFDTIPGRESTLLGGGDGD